MKISLIKFSLFSLVFNFNLLYRPRRFYSIRVKDKIKSFSLFLYLLIFYNYQFFTSYMLLKAYSRPFTVNFSFKKK